MHSARGQAVCFATSDRKIAALSCFGFSAHRSAGTPTRASSFVVEFQFSTLARPGAFGDDCVRDRLPGFLDKLDLERIRQMQNDVIKKLKLPPEDYYMLAVPENVKRWYLDKFKPVELPFKRSGDIWLRYHDEEDLTMWAEFVLERLPKVLARLTA